MSTINTQQVNKPKQILKNLHQVLVDAKQRFTNEFVSQDHCCPKKIS